ncbi:hypothetical protein L6164_009927 [Bauhinia variegata]|uniref:Uncharacterized protein n=1 Tax=Bauhinia variegata TaxID=167791 RepID=A0ACB9PRX2_BAUVA|nr:hypothetical protein L6164_009927 [Bauhinia variegata]
MSGEIPCASPDTKSVRITSGPLNPSDKVHSLPYVDPRRPGMELTCSNASILYFKVIMNSTIDHFCCSENCVSIEGLIPMVWEMLTGKKGLKVGNLSRTEM